jgi:hypothetical protein
VLPVSGQVIEISLASVRRQEILTNPDRQGEHGCVRDAFKNALRLLPRAAVMSTLRAALAGTG